MCGVAAPVVYVATDLLAGNLYPGYSFTEQAVSELFAIGAPTSRLVVPLLSLSSGLLAAFAYGVWLTSTSHRSMRILAWLILGNAVDGLVLWNFFPMHMRGAEPTFTDAAHLVLATNPFVLASIVLGAVAFRDWFRFYSIGTIVLLVSTATVSFLSAPEVFASEHTPWMGLTERIAICGHQLWHAVLAIVLLRRQGAGMFPGGPRRGHLAERA